MEGHTKNKKTYPSDDDKMQLIALRCRNESLIKAYRELLIKCIMNASVNFCELPQIIRVSSYALYATAFRVSYNDCDKSIDMLKCAIEDYHTICNTTDSQEYIHIFSFYYKVIDEQFSGEHEYDAFKKNIPRDILRELQI